MWKVWWMGIPVFFMMMSLFSSLYWSPASCATQHLLLQTFSYLCLHFKTLQFSGFKTLLGDSSTERTMKSHSYLVHYHLQSALPLWSHLSPPQLVRQESPPLRKWGSDSWIAQGHSAAKWYSHIQKPDFLNRSSVTFSTLPCWLQAAGGLLCAPLLCHCGVFF